MTYKEFKKKYNGKYVDYDKAYGAQCWDLAQKYFTECLKLPASLLGGVGLVSNMLKGNKYKEMLKYFDKVNINSVCSGDVVIWEYGHIAIFDSKNGKSLSFFSQNTGSAINPIGPAKVIIINKSGMHIFRKKESVEKTSGSNYYAKCKYTGESIVDGLKSIGIDSSYINRVKIATINGIRGYVGLSSQNIKLLKLLKNGKLKKKV